MASLRRLFAIAVPRHGRFAFVLLATLFALHPYEASVVSGASHPDGHAHGRSEETHPYFIVEPDIIFDLSGRELLSALAGLHEDDLWIELGASKNWMMLSYLSRELFSLAPRSWKLPVAPTHVARCIALGLEPALSEGSSDGSSETIAAIRALANAESIAQSMPGQRYRRFYETDLLHLPNHAIPAGRARLVSDGRGPLGGYAHPFDLAFEKALALLAPQGQLHTHQGVFTFVFPPNAEIPARELAAFGADRLHNLSDDSLANGYLYQGLRHVLRQMPIQDHYVPWLQSISGVTVSELPESKKMKDLLGAPLRRFIITRQSTRAPLVPRLEPILILPGHPPLRVYLALRHR